MYCFDICAESQVSTKESENLQQYPGSATHDSVNLLLQFSFYVCVCFSLCVQCLFR